MVNEVINGITEALHREFPDCKIYTEDVHQGLEAPCFIVTSVQPGRVKKSFVTYEYTEQIAIQYFPLEERAEMNDVVDRLQDCLEVIEVQYENGTKRTRTVMNSSAVADGVLTCGIRVADVYFRIYEGSPMTDMDNVKIGVTNG